jgi:molecular chaperone HscA
MLRASMEHAREDVELRMQKEQQVEAQRVIEAINAALAQDGEVLLSKSEIARIRWHRDKLEAVMGTASATELKQLIKAIEDASKAYVAKRMNASVKQALAGKQINEVDI